ncbi:MAG: 2-hydroxyacid dehydrogenase [Phycisphaeraceae bacterium]|nr:2-hydroxyacid dehydrogenase [Phycisphaerae bacterium]MBX3392314.1 2-hydroxyacid dehydrogenase [Phycisphaeraceae bacterium]
MRVAFFSVKKYERPFFDDAAAGKGHEIDYIEAPASAATAGLAQGCGAACVFVNDRLDRPAVERLKQAGVGMIALRSAGFNHVDVEAAADLGIALARVPEYSPHAVAEHAVALILTLNRHTHRAFNRVREHDFSIDGLMGFDLHGKTVGCVGTGKIGSVFCRIMTGFGCRVLAADPFVSPDMEKLGVRYVTLDELASSSDIVALHCPLTPATRHVIDRPRLEMMKPGAMLINTSRGGLVDTPALVGALKARRLGGVGLDVYEEEADLFFRDLSEEVIRDDVFARLLTFPNVIVTSHQAFFTREAMTAIAKVSMKNIDDFARGGPGAIDPANAVPLPRRGA